MSVETMKAAVEDLRTYLLGYTGTGETLEDVVKIYRGGVNPLMAEFPCLVIKAIGQDREYKRTGGRRSHAYDRVFHLLIGVFYYIEDITEAFDGAVDLAHNVMAILETDTDIDGMGYEVTYDGTIDYGTVEFGGDQAFCFGVSVPLRIEAKGT